MATSDSAEKLSNPVIACPKGKPPGTKGYTVQWVQQIWEFPLWRVRKFNLRKHLEWPPPPPDIHLIDRTFLCSVDAWPGYQNFAHLWPLLLLIQLCKLGTSVIHWIALVINLQCISDITYYSFLATRIEILYTKFRLKQCSHPQNSLHWAQSECLWDLSKELQDFPQYTKDG